MFVISSSGRSPGRVIVLPSALASAAASALAKSLMLKFFSSPEHEVLMVSYCDQSLSVVRRASCVIRRQQFVLKANSS